MRAIMQMLYVTRRMAVRILRLRTRGVKVMLFNQHGELLLIRNSYGQSNLYVLPGGGIGRGETPAAAAAREVREEVGLEVDDLHLLGTHASIAEGKRDTIHLFSGVARGRVQVDGWEVEAARFFPLDALPANTSAATLRRIAEFNGQRVREVAW